MSEQSQHQNTLDQAMNLWITPEITRRQAAGQTPKTYDLRCAQIIFHADGRPHEIRLNDEVKALGKVKLRAGVTKNIGDQIYTHEIESYEEFRLPDDDDPNCGHLTIYRYGDQWTLIFDFIYNKGLANDNLSAAREFLCSAKSALGQGSYRVFVDTCFSAAELAAKALLLTTPDPKYDRKMSHGRIHSRYNLEAKFGNVQSHHKDALNRLSDLRGAARYLNTPLNITDAEADELAKVVEEAIEYAEKRTKPTKAK